MASIVIGTGKLSMDSTAFEQGLSRLTRGEPSILTAIRGHRKPLIPSKEPRPFSDEAIKYRKARIG